MKKSHGKIILYTLSILLTSFYGSVLHASFFSYCHDIFDYTMAAMTVSHEGHTITVHSPETNTTQEIHLETKLANGMAGSVYTTGQPSKMARSTSEFPYGRIIKIPHMFKWGHKHPLSEKAITNELKMYQEALALRSALQNVVPQMEYWPICPIAQSGTTSLGPVIIKPFIKAKTFSSVLADHGGFKKLPFQEKENLQKIRIFILELEKLLEKEYGIKGRIDANPKNLAWVSDKTSMDLLGMKEPGLVFFELTIETGIWSRPHLDFIRNRFFFGEP